ncbi:hypothetical protein NW837_12610, partial [Synechococcus sp. R6-10]
SVLLTAAFRRCRSRRSVATLTRLLRRLRWLLGGRGGVTSAAILLPARAQRQHGNHCQQRQTQCQQLLHVNLL